MSVNNLFYWSYWFSQPYIARGWVEWILFGGFLVLIVAGAAFQIAKFFQGDNLKKELFNRLSNLTIFLGCFGLVWMFFRQERVVFLAWRFWLWLWFLIAVLWLYKIIHFAVKRVPAIRTEQAQKEIKDKYLPGKK